MFEEGEACPLCGNDISFLYRGGGCTCFLGNPPCGYCTTSYYGCISCELDADSFEWIARRFNLPSNHTNWNSTEKLIFEKAASDAEKTMKHFKNFCETHEVSTNHSEWDEAERVLFRLAV